MSELVRKLHRTTLLRDEAEWTDGALLEHYLSCCDEAALAALVHRHGPMVWGVCCRLLHDYHDAEDAFQATFLVLVRKARSVRPREMIGNWLYGVAHQTALKARATKGTRKRRETQVAEMPEMPVTEQAQWYDLRPVLDEELSRLPEKYRAVVVLCDLEGHTRKETARQLELPEGTVAGWIARARKMLAERLTKRGIVLSAGALTVLISENRSSAGMSSTVVSSTVNVALLVAEEQMATAGLLSLRPIGFMEGVLQTMMTNKIRLVVSLVVMLGLLTVGGPVLRSNAGAYEEKQQGTGKRQTGVGQDPSEKDSEPSRIVAAGKEVDGLRAILAFSKKRKPFYTHGETVDLVVRLRNVGKETVEFKTAIVFMLRPPLIVMDSKGKAVYVQCLRPVMFNGPIPDKTKLAPGKEIVFDELPIKLRSPAEANSGNRRRNEHTNMALFGTGKFRIQYRTFGLSTTGRILCTTGPLDIEVRPAPTKQPVITPEEAIRIASSSELLKKYDVTKPAVEFKVQSVIKSILVKSSGEKDAPWAHGHSPDDMCLRPQPPKERSKPRFLAILTGDVLGKMKRLGITDVKKHFAGKTIRVKGSMSWAHYDGFGTPSEVEIVIDDLSQLEVVK